MPGRGFFQGIETIKYDRRYCVVLELLPLRGEKISRHTHKTGSWYLLSVFFKISDMHPCPFYMGVSPPPHPWGKLSSPLSDNRRIVPSMIPDSKTERNTKRDIFMTSQTIMRF